MVVSVNSPRAKEDHWKCFVLFFCFCVFFWLVIDVAVIVLNISRTVFKERLIVLNKFIVLGHISLAFPIKPDFINSPLVNGFSLLLTHEPVRNFTLVAVSFLFLWRDSALMRFCLKFLNFSDCCFLVKWGCCDECLFW